MGAAKESGSVQVRQLVAGDVDGFVDLLVRNGEPLGGVKAPVVLRAVARDAADPAGAAVIVVADDGGVRGAVVALLGGSWAYWRRFPLRHPVAGAYLLWRRARKLVRARLARRRPGAVEASVAASTFELPAALRDDPRLAVPMGPRGGDLPHLRDAGAHLAYGALAVVDPSHRAQGLGTALHREAFRALASRGVRRYDTSFLFDYEPSIRMYLGLGFDVYRGPHGYFGSIEVGGAR